MKHALIGQLIAAISCGISAAGIAAEWIAGSYVPPAESNTAAFFEPAQNDVVERVFRTRDVAIARAEWRVAAPGMRDLFVNGVRVSSTALPPFTPYRKRILEEAFDVTVHVRPGASNVLRVELGNGWYNPLPLKMWYIYNLRDHLAVGKPCVKATLEIAYADGMRDTVATDDTWYAYAWGSRSTTSRPNGNRPSTRTFPTTSTKRSRTSGAASRT